MANRLSDLAMKVFIKFTPRRIRKFAGAHVSQHIIELLRGMPSQYRNLEYNRAYWDGYARLWDKKRVQIDNPEVDDDQRMSYLTCLGDEWGKKADVDIIVQEYIYPYITRDSIVAEIGVGGGRIAVRVAGMVKELYCFDVSGEMLRKAQAALADYSNVKFGLLLSPTLPDVLVGCCDFIYAFDVFHHLDLHTIRKYFVEIYRGLKQDGHAFISTTNLKSPVGWERFESQTEFSIGTHYFISPEIIEILASHSGFKIIKASTPDMANWYLSRDYLVVLEKAG